MALMELDVHAKLEEELINPAIRQEIDDEELMDEHSKSIMSCTGYSAN